MCQQTTASRAAYSIWASVRCSADQSEFWPRLVEFDVEIGLRRVCEARLVFAEGQAARLHRAMHLRRGDAVVFEEREFEGRVVGDQHHVVQALKDGRACAEQVNDSNAPAAAV